MRTRKYIYDLTRMYLVNPVNPINKVLNDRKNYEQEELLGICMQWRIN